MKRKMGRPPIKTKNRKVPLNIPVDPTTKRRLSKESDRLGLSRTELSRRCIEIGLRYYEKKETEETVDLREVMD